MFANQHPKDRASVFLPVHYDGREFSKVGPDDVKIRIVPGAQEVHSLSLHEDLDDLVVVIDGHMGLALLQVCVSDYGVVQPIEEDDIGIDLNQSFLKVIRHIDQ